MSDQSIRNQLAVPAGAAEDPRAFELVRAWVVHGGLQVSMEMGGWEDPSAWGSVLADLARHVAAFYEERRGLDADDTLARLLQAMDAELDGD